MQINQKVTFAHLYIKQQLQQISNDRVGLRREDGWQAMPYGEATVAWGDLQPQKEPGSSGRQRRKRRTPHPALAPASATPQGPPGTLLQDSVTPLSQEGRKQSPMIRLLSQRLCVKNKINNKEHIFNPIETLQGRGIESSRRIFHALKVTARLVILSIFAKIHGSHKSGFGWKVLFPNEEIT